MKSQEMILLFVYIGNATIKDLKLIVQILNTLFSAKRMDFLKKIINISA